MFYRNTKWGSRSNPCNINRYRMFDFERLDIYKVLRDLNQLVYTLLGENKKIDPFIKEQWKAASQKAILNLVEGTGRIMNEDKKKFITLSRGAIFESVAIVQQVFDQGHLTPEKYQELYDKYEQASKMLLGMYRSYNQ
jgi:four helix bundle protein